MGFTSKGYRISFFSDENILKVTVMQLCDYTRKYCCMHVINGRILWHVNYISIKNTTLSHGAGSGGLVMFKGDNRACLVACLFKMLATVITVLIPK